jgi:hypothetical protein
MNETQKLVSSPTLNTILMVENALINMKESIFSMAGIKKALPKQINHNVLKKILEYLEYSNKIAVSIKGISWIFNPNKRLREELTKGLEL